MLTVAARRGHVVHSLILCTLVLLATLNVRLIESSTHAERELARKLIKLFLAAAVLSPPGLGLFPVPLPLPVPFGIETLKPPIYAPFGFPFLHGGGFGGGLGGYGVGGLGGGGLGGIGGGGGGGYAAAASELQPTVIVLPVVRTDSEAAANAITRIPVTSPQVSRSKFTHSSLGHGRHLLNPGTNDFIVRQDVHQLHHQQQQQQPQQQTGIGVREAAKVHQDSPALLLQNHKLS